MRKIISLMLSLVVAASCLAGCGGGSNYKEQKVKYDGAFEITCVKDEIVCDTGSSVKTDNLVLTLAIKNIGKKDAKITSVANIITKQGDKILFSSNLRDKEGQLYSFYRDQIIPKGKTVKLKYAWQLSDSEKDVDVDFKGYVVGSDAGKMTFKVKGRETEYHAKYVKESKKEYESKSKIKEASLKALDVKIPDGWIIRTVSDSRVEMQKDNTSGPTQIIAISSYSILTPKPKAEAERYIGNFNNSKLKVKKYKIAGENFYGFEPVDTQFYLYGKSSDNYRIEVSGMQVAYKDVKKLLNKMIKVK